MALDGALFLSMRKAKGDLLCKLGIHKKSKYITATITKVENGKRRDLEYYVCDRCCKRLSLVKPEKQ